MQERCIFTFYSFRQRPHRKVDNCILLESNEQSILAGVEWINSHKGTNNALIFNTSF